MPPWAIGIIAVVVVGSAVWVGWKVYQKSKDRKDTAEGREEIKEVKGDLKELAKKDIKPSFADSRYQSLANQIQESLDGCGTNEQVVIKAFSEMMNDADVLKLVTAYGVREYDNCGYGTGDFKGTLSQAIVNEMDVSERAKLNKSLAAKGITYTF